MSRRNCFFAVVALAAIVALMPVANAQAVHYVGVGSSAMFNGFAVAAFNDLVVGKTLTAPTPAGHCPVGHVCTANHWSTNVGGAAFCKDTRQNTALVSPANQNGTLWIVWVEDTTAGTALDVWTYLNVDSTVGLRCFLARPATSLILTSVAGTAGNNVVGASNFLAPGNAGDVPVTAAVLAALNEPAGTPFTAGMTDIRPEDGLLATHRILGSGNASLAAGCSVADPGDTVPTPLDPYGNPCWFIYSFALGYGNPGYDPGTTSQQAGIGNSILSGEPGSTAAAQPVLFGLPGLSDPLSGAAVPPTIKTIPIGEAPIMFVTNRSNAAGLGQPIGSYVAAGNCYSPGLTDCQPDNTGQPVGYVSDGSYYARNVWDQHPWPMINNVYPALGGVASPTDPSGNGVCPGNGWSTPECHVTRRPLGNLFTSGDCEGDSSVFTWPLAPGITQGLRAQIPNRQAFALNLFLREPLSGTYNTTEFDVMRPFGTPGGSMGSNDPGAAVPPAVYAGGDTFEQLPYVSQESNIIQPGDQALNKQCQADFGEVNPANEGFRIRGIGTGEVRSGPGGAAAFGKGVLNTPDSMTYLFFSFGNVSALSWSKSFGYTMLDATDPIFDNYENAIAGGAAGTQFAATSTGNGANVEGEPICEGGGAPVAGTCPFSLAKPLSQEPGQPANNAAFLGAPGGIAGFGFPIATPQPLSWGILPKCGGAAPQPACNAAAIWHTPVAGDASANCPAGSPCTYPHLRDGSYRAWSELRLLCDSAVASCSTDPLGAEALVQNLQRDIHVSALGGVPDLLPMSDAAAGPLSFNPPWGDVSFLRDHYAFVATDETDLHSRVTPFDLCANVTTHESNIRVVFGGGATGCGVNTPVNGPPTAECGGDAGGYIRAAVPANYVPFYGANGAVAPGCPSVGAPGDLQ